MGLLVLVQCAWGPGTRIEDPVLPGRDILALARGNTLALRTHAGGEIEVFLRRDGRAFMRGRNDAGIPFQDAGWWSIEDDRLCTRWDEVRGNRKVCEWITYDGQVLDTYDPAGRPTARGRVVEGKPPGIERRPPRPPLAQG